MFVDRTTEEFFKEKNSEILREKLVLDIGNNDDSLQLTVKNKILLITSNTIRKINCLLRENNVEYDVRTLTELFNSYGQDIITLVFGILNNRKKFLSENVTSENRTSIQELTDSINEFVEEFKNNFELRLDEIIHITIREDFLSKYTFKDETTKEELIMILERYDSDLARSVNEAVLERNANLLNIFRETNEKVSELDNKTTGKVNEKK